MQEAIQAYSMGGHHAIHGQPHKGLTEGQIADFAILNGHPENSSVQVISTWIDGKQVFSKTAGQDRTSLADFSHKCAILKKLSQRVHSRFDQKPM
jgi:hypothetical protein